MRKTAFAIAAIATIALTAGTAQAGSVLTAQMSDSYVNVGDKLRGNWDAVFVGDVGSNTATLTGQFHITGGSYRYWFGGTGASVTLSATLTNFQSNVTGTTGINTQPAFGGDIFSEAGSYAPSGSSWNPSEFISFSFGELFIEGVNGAYLAAGRGSTSTPVGKIYNYNGNTLVNFWMNRSTFNSPWDSKRVISHGDWIATVNGHTTNGGGDPVPEPSTYAMLLLGMTGLGVWTRRKRRAAAEADADADEVTAEETDAVEAA